MYGLLITARMNERLHNAVHRCRWRLDPLCVLLQTIRQPRCMGCFYLRPVIDVLNCPLWLVRLARTGWFHVIRARSLSLSLSMMTKRSGQPFLRQKLHPPISARPLLHAHLLRRTTRRWKSERIGFLCSKKLKIRGLRIIIEQKGETRDYKTG